MKLLMFSDIHGDSVALERLVSIEADHYFCAGDLANWGKGLEAMGRILAPLAGKLSVIPGNHESAADVAGFCAQFGFHDFHGGRIELGGWTIGGLGYSNVTPFQTPGEFTEAEFTQRLGAFSGIPRLAMVCHCPPKDSLLDRAGEGKHFGSPAVRAFIEREQPGYFFCGHIHEAAGVKETIGGTFGMNVGKAGYLLELGPV